MDFLSGLLGSIGSVVSGLMGQNTQENINAANQAQALFMANNAISMRVDDARRAGINPLAALGSSFSPGPATMVGSNALGEGVSEAAKRLAAGAPAEDTEEDKLNRELLRTKIEAAKTDIVRGQLLNSKIATQVATPGLTPTTPWDWNQGGPRDPRVAKGRPQMFTEYYDPYDRSTMTMLSAEASQANQAAAAIPSAPLLAARLYGINMGLANPNVWRLPAPPDLPDFYTPF